VDTAKSTYALAKKYRVSMPIVEAVHGILFKNESPGKAVNALMHREFHRELD
jgi:glycerol-3-phosphate dehydrogenase